jgi:hypothetical protein
MKLVCVASVSLLVLSGAAHAADFVSTVESTSPIAFFRLTAPDTGSAVNGYTTSYTATTGTGTGAPLASDPANTGATFTGNNGAPSEIETSLAGGIAGKGSINAWINLAALPSTLGQYFYIAGESQGGNDFDFQIQNDDRLYIYTGGGENTSYALDPSIVGQWVMVTASYDGTLGADSYRNLYVDGVEVASYTGGVNGASKSNPFTIGYSDVFGNRDFDGSIDEVAVWNYGLNATQVADIYASRNDAGTTGAVPEPASWAMMLGGFGLVGGAMRRRQRTAIRFS